MTRTFTLRHGLLAVLGLILVGLLIAWLGIVNIAASTGHWMITDKFLHWSMRNAVRTRAALTIEDPRLDFTGLVSAAGHYSATCAVCHGAPGERPFAVMADYAEAGFDSFDMRPSTAPMMPSVGE